MCTHAGFKRGALSATSAAAMLLLGFVLSVSLGTSGARAEGYFVNAFTTSPAATYLFGDYSNSTSAAATSQTTYTNGVANYSAGGSATTDLSTGALHASVNANYGYAGACGNCDSPFLFGNANFGDSLTFMGSFTNQTVDFTVSVDGTWSGNCAACASGTLQFYALPSGTIAANSGNEFALFDTTAAWYNPINVGPSGTPTLTLTVPVILNGVNPTIDIAYSLDLTDDPFSVGDQETGDFTDTASVSFTPLNGVTVYSASGVFPDTLSATPLPATLPLFAGGLGFLGYLTRRRKRSGKQAFAVA